MQITSTGRYIIRLNSLKNVMFVEDTSKFLATATAWIIISLNLVSLIEICITAGQC